MALNIAFIVSISRGKPYVRNVFSVDFALYMPIAETASFASASPERMDNVFLNSSGGSELFASFLFSVPI